MGFQRVTVNLGGSVSYRELDGRRYAVVPCVLMAEGVWEGSGGPFFYPATALQNACPSWNHKPIVVYHPEENGLPISACSPEVLSAQGCGMLMNVRWEDEKQKGEAWLEIDKTNKVDDRIIPMLEKGEKIETSTGLIVDAVAVANEKGEPTEKEHKGKKYTNIADNHRPDHFAILPDRRGAFSVADGGGLLANEKEKVQAFATNEMSYSDISSTVCQQLENKFQKPGYYWTGYVVDVFPTFVVYRADGKYYSQSYAMKDGVPQLSGDPTEVVRVTEYRTANDGKYVGNSAVDFVPNKEPQMAFDRKAHVTKLIGNGFEEKDRVELEKLPDFVLEKIEPKKKEEPVKETPANNQLVANNEIAAPPATVEEWLKKTNAPVEVQNSVKRSLARDAAHKASLVKAIHSNAANPFSEAFLNQKDIQELEGLAAFAAASQPKKEQDVTNNGMFRDGYAFPASGAPVHNAVPSDEEPLEMPSIDAYLTNGSATK